MSGLVDPVLVAVVLLNFFLLGTSRLGAVINASAFQGILLSVLTFLVHGEVGLDGLLVGLGAMLLKGILIPLMLRRALVMTPIRREVEPFIGFGTSLMCGALSTGAVLFFSQDLPLIAEQAGSLIVPAALGTVMTGFIILVSRRKAITQVVGYLVLENGVFLFGLTLIEAMPFLVEVGVLLDLFVAIFVMGIVLNHIHREFHDLDTAHLTALKEE
jgi:hydrogenase-4 component E